MDSCAKRVRKRTETIWGYGTEREGVDASSRFLTALAGKTDPEEKRKTIGRVFIEVFDDEAHKITDAQWLAQGTIYPDVIESLSVKGTFSYYQITS